MIVPTRGRTRKLQVLDGAIRNISRGGQDDDNPFDHIIALWQLTQGQQQRIGDQNKARAQAHPEAIAGAYFFSKSLRSTPTGRRPEKRR